MHQVNGAKAAVKKAIRDLGKYASNDAARGLHTFLDKEVFSETHAPKTQAKPARKATSQVDKKAQIATVRAKWVAAHDSKDEASKLDCLDAAKQLPPASLRELLALTLSSPPKPASASASSTKAAKQLEDSAKKASKPSQPNRSAVVAKRPSSAIADVNENWPRKVRGTYYFYYQCDMSHLFVLLNML